MPRITARHNNMTAEVSVVGRLVKERVYDEQCNVVYANSADASWFEAGAQDDDALREHAERLAQHAASGGFRGWADT